MNCDSARDSIILAAYGELPDEQLIGLEQHLMSCEACASEVETMRQLDQQMGLYPMAEPDPNLLAQSRMRLDEALDAMPRRGFLARLRADAQSWMGHLTGAPALATLLVGVGFLAGNFVNQYEAAKAPKTPATVILSNTGGGISTISGVTQLPNDMVKVSYNRIVPEVAEGSLNDPQIRRLLMVGSSSADDTGVRAASVELISNECRIGHECKTETDGSGMRMVLLVSLRSDEDPSARLKALEGLQPYISQDEQVRDAVAHALLTDESAMVRKTAFTMLRPVDSDSSVRDVLRPVSTKDDNPYIRTISTEALRGTSSIQ